MKKPIFVLTGNYQEFLDILPSLPQLKTKYQYVNGLDTIRGLKDCSIAVLGTAEDRKDWPRLVDYFALANFNYIELCH